MTVFLNGHLDGGIRLSLCCKLTQRKIIKKTGIFLVNIYPFTMCFYEEKTLKYGHLTWYYSLNADFFLVSVFSNSD